MWVCVWLGMPRKFSFNSFAPVYLSPACVSSVYRLNKCNRVKGHYNNVYLGWNWLNRHVLVAVTQVDSTSRMGIIENDCSVKSDLKTQALKTIWLHFHKYVPKQNHVNQSYIHLAKQRNYMTVKVALVRFLTSPKDMTPYFLGGVKKQRQIKEAKKMSKNKREQGGHGAFSWSMFGRGQTSDPAHF